MHHIFKELITNLIAFVFDQLLYPIHKKQETFIIDIAKIASS